MRVLVLGSGGREHALAWRISQDRHKDSCVEQVYVYPGNAGMAFIPNVELVEEGCGNFESIRKFCIDKDISLVVVGPEALLAEGIVDYLQGEGIATYGPSKSAARLETSKIFAKEFMQRHGIPTAPFKVYESYQEALEGLDDWDISAGIAIKADTLAGGKGVVVTDKIDVAKETLYHFMEDPNCSVKSSRILIEKKLVGKEVSAFALCDGNSFFNLGMACDYKRVGNGDTGPNTGGMGCYTPKNWPSSLTKSAIENDILSKVIEGIKQEGHPFMGTLFAGLMIEEEKPYVIEFNVRFGDPETQTLLPLVDGDFTSLLLACAKGSLVDSEYVSLFDRYSVHIVMASGGYPSTFREPMNVGNKISFDSTLADNSYHKRKLFFAGVKKEGERLVNNGGRVLGVTALGKSLQEARTSAYAIVGDIAFEGAHFRRDIGVLGQKFNEYSSD